MPDQDEKHIFVDLQKITEKKADALLYCLSILSNSKLDDVEPKSIKLNVDSSTIWKKHMGENNHRIHVCKCHAIEMNDNDT